MRPGVMEYAGKKLKELSTYLGEKNWFAGETVCDYEEYIMYMVFYVLFNMCINLCLLR